MSLFLEPNRLRTMPAISFHFTRTQGVADQPVAGLRRSAPGTSSAAPNLQVQVCLVELCISKLLGFQERKQTNIKVFII